MRLHGQTAQAMTGIDDRYPEMTVEYETLPLSVRVADKLATMLILSEQLLAELDTTEGSPYSGSVTPVVRTTCHEVQLLMGKIAQ